MKFTATLIAAVALFSTAFAAPTESTNMMEIRESNMIEVRDAKTNAVVEGLAIDQRSVCYCYGGTCTPGCYGKKVEKRVCYCYGGFCTPGC